RQCPLVVFPRVPVSRMGWSMLPRLPSVSLNETYRPTPGIAIGSPSTFTACFRYFVCRFLDVVHRDDDGRVLVGPARFLRKESAIDRAGFSGTVVVGFGGGGRNVTAHVLAELLRVPAERRLVKLRHPISIVKGHFEVNNAVHDASPVHSLDNTGGLQSCRSGPSDVLRQS